MDIFCPDCNQKLIPVKIQSQETKKVFSEYLTKSSAASVLNFKNVNFKLFKENEVKQYFKNVFQTYFDSGVIKKIAEDYLKKYENIFEDADDIIILGDTFYLHKK